MKIIIIQICSVLLSFGSVFGQNLIQNGDFENKTNCPVNNPDFPLVGWSSPTRGTPDYFHICGSIPTGVPSNYIGYEFANSDSAYCGLVIKNTGTNTVDWREYIQTSLTTPLIPKLKYELTMHVSLGEMSKFGSDAIGALFSTTPIFRNDQYRFAQTPQVLNQSSNFITNKNGWTLISLSFVADSAYQFITIGNFFVDTNTAVVSVVGGHQNRSYFYIDDVSLTVSTSTGLNDQNISESIDLYPNPFNNTLQITGNFQETIEVTLYDIYSRKVLQSNFGSALKSINTSHLVKGTYYYTIRNQKGGLKSGILVRQ